MGRGALRKGRVPAHWPSGFSTRLPSTSGRRRKSKHGCVSHIDSLHRPFQPRSGAKVNIRYGGCPIGLGRTNQPEFCLSPHQSRLFLVHYTHTINRGRMREGSKSRAHPHGENKYWHNLLITNCFNSLKILLLLTSDPWKERPHENSLRIMASTNDHHQRRPAYDTLFWCHPCAP